MQEALIRGIGYDQYQLLELSWPDVEHEDNVVAHVTAGHTTIHISPMQEGLFYIQGGTCQGRYIEPHVVMENVLDIIYEDMTRQERSRAFLGIDVEPLSHIAR